MNSGFLVDVVALDQLITSLSETAERMHVANDRLRAASAADLGGADLDRAAGDFQSRWEHTDQAIAGLFPNPGNGATPAGQSPPPPDTPSPISRALDAGTSR